MNRIFIQPTLPPQQRQPGDWHVSKPLVYERPSELPQAESKGQFKCAIISLAVVLLLVITGLAVSLLISHLVPERRSGADENQALAVLNTPGSNIHIFYFNFQTGSELQLEERHPETGGLIGLNLTNVLDYSVCCKSQEYQFICLGGSTLNNNGATAFNALLQEDENEVYLLLWLNSRNLIEVGCIMRATLLQEN